MTDPNDEPTKLDPHGHITREWTSWEWRQAERRQRGAPRPPTEAEQLVARIDIAIADAGRVVEHAAMRKRRLEEVMEGEPGRAGSFLGRAGQVIAGSPNVGRLDELKRQHAGAAALLAQAKATEVDLRVMRNELSAGRVSYAVDLNVARPGDGSTPYSYSDTKLVDGKVR